MGLVISIVSIALIIAGLGFFFAAAVGIVRFPDFYTRMHAAGKGDTLSTLLILSGMAIYSLGELFHGSPLVLLVIVKILAIGGFIMLTSPTSTHALMQAGFDAEIKPYTKDNSGSDAEPAPPESEAR